MGHGREFGQGRANVRVGDGRGIPDRVPSVRFLPLGRWIPRLLQSKKPFVDTAEMPSKTATSSLAPEMDPSGRRLESFTF